MQPIQVPLKSILKYLTSIFLATEFASFVAGKIIQVIEAMPGFVVPLAMFLCFGKNGKFSRQSLWVRGQRQKKFSHFLSRHMFFYVFLKVKGGLFSSIFCLNDSFICKFGVF